MSKKISLRALKSQRSFRTRQLLMSKKISLRGQGVEEGVDGVWAPGPGHRAGVLTHVGEGDLLDDEVAVLLQPETDVVALGRLAVAGGPHHLVVPDILVLLQKSKDDVRWQSVE